MDDTDEFSDDGLDDSALQELESHTAHFAHDAQVQKSPQISQDDTRDYAEYGWEEDDDLDTTEVINDAGAPVGRPVVEQTLQHQPSQARPPQSKPQRRPIPPVPDPKWNPTVDPANRPSGSNLANRSRVLGAGPGNLATIGSQTSAASRPQPSQFAGPQLQKNRFGASQNAQAPPGDFVSALQQRVRVLESELNAARGESSIIRSNSVKTQQQYDAEVARLRKLNAEQMAKQERIVEAAVAAEKTANTELQFLQRDMREVNDRARRKEQATGGHGPGTLATTPRKTKSRDFADGFDDMDIAASPSKGQSRSRNAGSVAANVGERTPSKGKRKRPVVDSPVRALETHTGDLVIGGDKPAVHTTVQPLLVAPPAPPFEFLQLVLDHGCFHQQPPTFDIFSRFSFPSDTSTSFASIIFQKLPLMGNPHRPMQLLVDFSELILSLWTRCLEEKLWQPIQYLVSLISFTFDLHTTSVAPLIVPNLVPTAQATIGTLAEGRYRIPVGTIADNDEYRALEQNIDTTQVLSMMHAAALACATTTAETENGFESNVVEYWKLVSLDLALLLLTPKQNLSDVIGMLDLLAASSLPKSIGPITDDPDRDNTFVAHSVIERVSAKLTEQTRSAITAEEKRSVRLAALRALIAFARHPFGAIQLANHPNALPRLVTCLSASIDDLYDQFLSPSIIPGPSDDDSSEYFRDSAPDPTSRLNRIISQCVLLIQTLVTSQDTANIADISYKLSISHGGSQRYLIALGRLTFAEEDLILEAGIESEVVEAAHELLEMAVTPDEGELVSEAFGA